MRSVAQKKDIKRQKQRLDALKREHEEEQARAKEAARERVLQEFEKGQLGLGKSSLSTSAGTKSEDGSPVPHHPYLALLTSVPGRGTKRKFEFDSSTLDRLTREAEEAALLQIEREQAEALRAKLPDFWLPSLTPTYTSSGPPRSLKEVKVQTTCRGGNPSHPLT
jgi:nitric oxide synthase-interacting protein